MAIATSSLGGDALLGDAVLGEIEAKGLEPKAIAQTIITQTLPRNANPQQKQPRGQRPWIDRDPECPKIPKNQPVLTALTPLLDQYDQDGIGDTLTLSQNPSFYFYSPYTTGKYRFRLLASAKAETAIHSQIINTSDRSGILTVALPTLPIQQDQRYFWELEYVCSAKPNASRQTLYGYLYRLKLPPAQRLELSRAKTASDRLAFYQKYGIWSELLTEIAKAMPTSKSLWQKVLDSQGLEAISQQPLLPLSLSKP